MLTSVHDREIDFSPTMLTSGDESYPTLTRLPGPITESMEAEFAGASR